MTLTALVVDDDYRVADLHTEIVRSTPGFRALAPAGSIRAAREALAADRVDLLLADQYLPDGSGVDLIRAVDVDSLLITADRSPQTTRLALARGALSVVYKPFSAKDLTGRLAQYARRRRILDGAADMDQDLLDKALRALATPKSAETVENATLARLLELLRGAPEGLSASRLADAAGVSRPTAQRHLAAAAQAGSVRVELKYGSTGRPEHVYRI